MARDYTIREMRLVGEWLSREYGGQSFAMRVRLGTAHPELLADVADESERKMLEGAFRRYVDGLVTLKDRVVLVEAKIVLSAGAISQLELYDMLFPSTPEYRPWASLPRELVLLYAVEDPAVVALARSKGIRCVLFRPAWVNDYLKELRPSERNSPKSVPA